MMKKRRQKIRIAGPSLDVEEMRAVQKLFSNGRISQGKMVAKFENDLAKYTERKYAIATATGTLAENISLNVVDLKSGDKFILPTFLCNCPGYEVIRRGCRPVLCDIDADTYNMSPETVGDVMNDDIKGILLVHLFGHPCDMDPIVDMTKDKIIIEDAAQSIGAKYKGVKVGNTGITSFYSFYGTKNMTTGSGGALLTDDEEIAEKARTFRYGFDEPSSRRIETGKKIDYKNLAKWYGSNAFFIPSNCTMPDILAVIGSVQLSKLNRLNRTRRRIAKLYDEGLAKTGFKLPVEEKYAYHVYHRYSIQCDSEEERNRLIEHCRKRNIKVGILYESPLHLNPLFKQFGYKKGDFPVAEKVAKTVLSIPMHPKLTDEEVNYVIDSIRGFGYHSPT